MTDLINIQRYFNCKRLTAQYFVETRLQNRSMTHDRANLHFLGRYSLLQTFWKLRDRGWREKWSVCNLPSEAFICYKEFQSSPKVLKNIF